MRLRTGVLAIVAAVTAALTPVRSVCAEAQSPTPSVRQSAFAERPETDLLLLAVDVEHVRLSDTLAAYGDEKRVFIPLGEICRLLSFAIEVNVVEGTADGYFIRESRRFHLDARTATAVVEGKEIVLSRDDVEVHQDDIYIDTKAFGRCLPVTAVVDYNSSLLRLRPREPLPMQLAARRQVELSANAAALGYAGPSYPFVPNPYRLFDVPTIDFDSRMSSDRSSNTSRTEFMHSMLLTGDLLGLGTSVYESGVNGAFSDLRVTAARRDPFGNLLGPLHAREVAFGEVLFPGLDLVANAVSGPGFVLSSFPLEQRIQFDKQTFVGNLPLGWEVELRRNDILIGYQQASPDGRYRFADVPLLFGVNVFRFIFYGPQGQQREEIQTFNIGETLIPHGQFRYRLVGNQPHGSGERALVEAAYGVSEHISSNLSLSQVSLPSGVHRYGQAGVQGFSRGVFGFAEVTRDFQGGSMGRAGIQTSLRSFTLSAYRAELRHFVSEYFPGGPSLEVKARTSARVSGTVNSFGTAAIPLTIDAIRDDYVGRSPVYTVAGLVSQTLWRTSISERIFGTFGDERLVPRGRSLFGAMVLSRNVAQFSARGEYDFNLTPQFSPNTILLSVENRTIPPYLFSLSVVRTFTDRVTHYLAGASRDQGLFSLGAEIDLASRLGPSFRVFLSASLLRDPLSRRWRSYARSNAAQGAVAARVFVDANQNARFDAGEAPVEKAAFAVNRASSSFVTNQSGTSVITNLLSDQVTDISVSPSSLPDPLYVPERPGVRVVPRAGKTLVVDFPILITGEVTGTIYLERGGSVREAAGVNLQLLDQGGKVVKSTRTAYDGFYDIPGITPGVYSLRVSPEQATRIGASAAPRKVEIAASGTILDGLNIILTATSVTTEPARPIETDEGTRRWREATIVAISDPVAGQEAFEALLLTPGLKQDLIRESAQALVALGDFAAARRAFDRLSPFPQDAELGLDYAIALFETGAYAAAKQQLDRVIDRIPRTLRLEHYRRKIERAAAR